MLTFYDSVPEIYIPVQLLTAKVVFKTEVSSSLFDHLSAFPHCWSDAVQQLDICIFFYTACCSSVIAAVQKACSGMHWIPHGMTFFFFFFYLRAGSVLEDSASPDWGYQRFKTEAFDNVRASPFIASAVLADFECYSYSWKPDIVLRLCWSWCCVGRIKCQAGAPLSLDGEISTHIQSVTELGGTSVCRLNPWPGFVADH